MNELVQYCDRKDVSGYYHNDVDTRQARILRNYLIASLLGGDTNDVRIYSPSGVCVRHASFN